MRINSKEQELIELFELALRMLRNENLLTQTDLVAINIEIRDRMKNKTQQEKIELKKKTEPENYSLTHFQNVKNYKTVSLPNEIDKDPFFD